MIEATSDHIGSITGEGDFLRSILDNLYHISIMVCDADPVGAIRFANRYFCRQNGVDPAHVTSCYATDFASVPDDEIGKISDAIDRVLADQGPVKVQGYFRSAGGGDGERALWGLMIIQRLDLSGRAPLLMFTTLDIGALGLHLRPGQATTTLTKEMGWIAPEPPAPARGGDTPSERDFYKAILDGLGAISIMAVDTEPVGAIRFGNAYFCAYNGVSYRQALTMNAYDFAPTPDDDLAKINDAIGRVIAGEKAVMTHGYFRSKRNAGSFWGLIVVRRLDRPGGAPCLTFVTVDLSLLGLLAETTLMNAEQVRAITTAAQDGVVMIDKEGAILYWNVMAERMTGVMAESALGRRLCELAVPVDDRRAFREALDRRLSGDDAPPFESALNGADGAPFPVEVSASLVRREDGGWGGVLFIRNITLRKEAERRLITALDEAREAVRLKDQFVTLVSHDLRSPLSGVAGALRLSVKSLDGAGGEKVIKMLTQSQKTVEGLLKMIDTLLDLSRLKSGRVTPQPRSADAYSFLIEAVAPLRVTADCKGVELSVKAPFGLRFFADPELLGQVIYNLVANAIKFTDPGGRVTVTVRKEDPRTIAICDSGVGITPERLATIFDAETARSTPGTDGERGHGFGLPLSAELMRIQGGELSVSSHPGEGSVFTCHLPEARPTLMVVDDDSLDRMAVMGYLAENGFTFVEAENGLQALESIRNDLPHLALVDLQMPQMDGFTLLERLRAESATATLPVIVMTADSDMEVRRRAFALGADDFVVKPINPEDFLPRVLRFLALSASQGAGPRR